MIGRYKVRYNGETVGDVEVSREGLYYRIRCICRLNGDKIYRLTLSDMNLGILVPEHGEFYLNVKRPVKHCLFNRPDFSIADSSNNWQPVSRDKPFCFLQSMDTARLQIRDGVPGILLTNRAEAPQGSDPSP